MRGDGCYPVCCEVEADKECLVGETEYKEGSLVVSLVWGIMRGKVGTHGIVVIVPEDSADVLGDGLVACRTGREGPVESAMAQAGILGAPRNGTHEYMCM